MNVAELQNKQRAMKQSIKNSVETIQNKNHDKKLEIERDSCMQSLLLAQDTMTEMTKYLSESMESVNKATARLIDSNQTVKDTVKEQISSLDVQSQVIVKQIGAESAKSVAESLKSLDEQFKNIVQQHQQIAQQIHHNINSAQQWGTARWIINFAWKWTIFMMITAFVKHYFQVDGIFSMLKIWLIGILV